jgi:hypothetical protein
MPGLIAQLAWFPDHQTSQVFNLLCRPALKLVIPMATEDRLLSIDGQGQASIRNLLRLAWRTSGTSTR